MASSIDSLHAHLKLKRRTLINPCRLHLRDRSLLSWISIFATRLFSQWHCSTPLQIGQKTAQWTCRWTLRQELTISSPWKASTKFLNSDKRDSSSQIVAFDLPSRWRGIILCREPYLQKKQSRTSILNSNSPISRPLTQKESLRKLNKGQRLLTKEPSLLTRLLTQVRGFQMLKTGCLKQRLRFRNFSVLSQLQLLQIQRALWGKPHWTTLHSHILGYSHNFSLANKGPSVASALDKSVWRTPRIYDFQC